MALTISELNNQWTEQHNRSGRGKFTLIAKDEEGFVKYSVGRFLSRIGDVYRGTTQSYTSNPSSVDALPPIDFNNYGQPFDRINMFIEEFELKQVKPGNDVELFIRNANYLNPKIKLSLLKPSKMYFGSKQEASSFIRDRGLITYFLFSINSIEI